MWIKWRHKYADGPGEWEWKDFGDREVSYDELEDRRADLGAVHGWEANYLGVESCLVSTPPIDHLRKVIKEHKTSIRNLQSAVARLESIVQELETPEHA